MGFVVMGGQAERVGGRHQVACHVVGVRGGATARCGDRGEQARGLGPAADRRLGPGRVGVSGDASRRARRGRRCPGGCYQPGGGVGGDALGNTVLGSIGPGLVSERPAIYLPFARRKYPGPSPEVISDETGTEFLNLLPDTSQKYLGLFNAANPASS